MPHMIVINVKQVVEHGITFFPIRKTIFEIILSIELNVSKKLNKIYQPHIILEIYLSIFVYSTYS